MALKNSWREFGDTQRRGARVLDNAEGVLIGLRRCEAGAAFNEILFAARQHGQPVFAIAEALVTLASGRVQPQTVSCAAMTAARREWGALLDCSPADTASRPDDAADRAGQNTVSQ